MLRGLDPRRHRLLERENPRTLFGINLGNKTGADLNLNNSRIAVNSCHCNTGGYMTLAQLGVAFWHDLAAPIIAGTIASLIVSWLRNRK